MQFVEGTEGFNRPITAVSLQNILDREIEKMDDVARSSVSEMSDMELKFLTSLVRLANPKKVLELGVSAGGTTKVLLDELPRETLFFSVDLLDYYYREKSKPVGYIAREMYNQARHAKWKLFPGQDITACIEDIGNEIDFLVLDTLHALPGEFLSFLVVLPYLKEGAVIVLHDTSLFANRVKTEGAPGSRPAYYCNDLLFAAIASSTKLLPPEENPNIGALIFNRDLVMRHIQSVFYMLLLPWCNNPDSAVLEQTARFVDHNYPPVMRSFFQLAVQRHKERTAKAEQETAHALENYYQLAVNPIELMQKEPYTVEVKPNGKTKLTVSGRVVQHEKVDFRGSLLYLTLDGKNREVKGLMHSDWLNVYYHYLAARDRNGDFLFSFDLPPGVATVGVSFLNVSNFRSFLAGEPKITLS